MFNTVPFMHGRCLLSLSFLCVRDSTLNDICSGCATVDIVLVATPTAVVLEPTFTKYVSCALCIKTCTMRSHTSAPFDSQFPHLLQLLLLKQICNNPTVHYTTAPSFIQFPHFIHNFIRSGCVQISESHCTCKYPQYICTD